MAPNRPTQNTFSQSKFVQILPSKEENHLAFISVDIQRTISTANVQILAQFEQKYQDS
jgi:hypothetical protein